MLNVFINGSSGKMGLSLINLINQYKEFNLITEDISLSDVVIDFSHPSSTFKIVKECSAKEIPLIIGTTGLNEEILNEIATASKNIPILTWYSDSGMSKVSIDKFILNCQRMKKRRGVDFDIVEEQFYRNLFIEVEK